MTARFTYLHLLAVVAGVVVVTLVAPRLIGIGTTSRPQLAPLQFPPLLPPDVTRRPLVSIVATPENPFARVESADEYRVRLELITSSETDLGGMATSPALDLCVVLDRSGSMGGDRLLNSKLAIDRIIRELRTNDRLHFVVYDDAAETVFSHKDLRHQDYMLEAVHAVQVRGSTNLDGGLQMCLDNLLAVGAHPGRLRQVMLFSDGQANSGVSHRETIVERMVGKINAEAAQAAKAASRLDSGSASPPVILAPPITVSAFGIGDGFDETLMAAIARRGGGDFYFLSNSRDIGPLVNRAMASNTHAVGSAATLHLTGLAGATVVKVYALQGSSRDPTEVNVGRLVANDKRTYLVALSTQRVPFGSAPQDVLRVELRYFDGYRMVSVEDTVAVQLTNDAAEVSAHGNAEIAALHTLKTVQEQDLAVEQLLRAGHTEAAKQTAQAQMASFSTIPSDVSGQGAFHAQHARMMKRNAILNDVSQGLPVQQKWSQYAVEAGVPASILRDTEIDEDTWKV